MSKDDNTGLGCLIIMGILIVWTIAKAVVNWSNENPGAMIGAAIAVGAGAVCWIVWRVTKKSRKKRLSFDRDYGEWLDGVGASLDDAEKFAKEDSKWARELDNRITDLENAVRKIH